MDPVVDNSITDANNLEEHQSLTESSVRPTLSQVKKSWGFRRTTIARREFMEEVGDLTHSPPLVRRGRSRRANQAPQNTTEARTTQRTTHATRSVIDDLEWSAPSSPVSEESKPASAAGSLDPSLWQDFGSAFHTAFSLLGGNDGLSMDMAETLADSDILETTDEALLSQSIDETEVSDVMESAEDIKILLPVAPNNGGEEETQDIVIISSQEEDSDEMTLLQIKEQLAYKGRKGDTRAKGGKGGRGKARGRARGRGRGKGKGRGRGRGRGRAAELQSGIASDEQSDDDVVLVSPAEQQLQQLHNDEKANDRLIASAEVSPVHCPIQQSTPDCIIIDADLEQITDVTPGQYDDAPEEVGEEKKDIKIVGDNSSITDTEGYDSNALYCICRQKHNQRFMICCDSCQEWFHGDCVGINETQGHKIGKKGQQFICPPCTAKKQRLFEPPSQPEPELSFSKCLTLSPCGEESEGHREPQLFKETVQVEEEQEQAPVMKPQPEAEMETNSCLPLCIGPGCSKQALPDSGYCGTDCILQHAAVTMKALSGPKMPKSRGRAPRKAAVARPIVGGQRSIRTSKRLAEKAEEECEEMDADDGGHTGTEPSLACDPNLTEVQAPSIRSSQFYTPSKKDIKEAETDSEAVPCSTLSPEDTVTDAAHSSQFVIEPAPPLRDSQEKANELVNSEMSKQQSAELCPAKSIPSRAEQSPSNSTPRHHETGALMVTKTTYVIPKKPVGPQTPSCSHILPSCQKPSSASALLNETRNLPVPPAPSAPSSRPSQPNTQVRQSIQRSLSTILSKRLCDCEDLDMSESEVAKLVASIEMEMFDIFRNTDSKYMNKYRTIMFNIKDPRNKGLLYRVVRGEISPFRLVRMSQKDMQATKAPEPSAKESEVNASAKATSMLQKPEAVKVDLPSLPSPAMPDRRPVRRPESTVVSQEQKRRLPVPALKTKTNQLNQGRAAPDVLACMLKDTTSEHKAHLFDLKCKICTGQIIAGQEDEPAKKKPKVSESRDKHEPPWRQSAGDDSPLQAPPDSPDLDSQTSSLLDPTSRLIIDSSALTIVESPASPTMDSPASPILDSPASPVMEFPASPSKDSNNAPKPKRTYTPVVIPAVSTVTFTRRDPRTVASRFSALSGSSSSPSSTIHNQLAPSYCPVKETSSDACTATVSSLTSMKALPKSILMKPSSSADPRLYDTSSRTVISESPTDGETAQLLAKQDILWKGFLNMLTVAKFVTKAYLVSGCAENLKADLPDTIQIGGRIMPQTVWDYVAKLKTSVTKELCVIRFHPATEEEEVAYVSLFSYFSSRGRFGVVANNSRSIKDVYLVPLSAKEAIPSILQPLEGPGLEKNRPNILLGLAIIQKTKRPASVFQEIEDKRPSVHMSKDPMWIPKPPVLYGSDKLEIFQPYDPETPASTSPPGSPPCPGSPSDSSPSGSVTIPALLTPLKATPPVSTSAVGAATHSISNSITDKNPSPAHSRKTPLQTILKTLFGNKQTNSTVSCDESSTTTTVCDKKSAVLSQVSQSMLDPIVQQYGQKSKVKEMEQEENDFDRPYDPEEEYDPAMGYGITASSNTKKPKINYPALSGFVEDDVAYDPEDETIFQDIQSDTVVTKPSVQISDSLLCPTPLSSHSVTPATTSIPEPTSTPATLMPNLPTGTVVVSAATLTEQQRMLEELNKQIEEQKRQLKEQEEALRQQKEAVGMFMAHFSVSDSLMSPPQKSLPLSQLSPQTTNTTSNSTETVNKSNIDLQTLKQEDKTVIANFKNDTDTVTDQDGTQEIVKESDNYSSAGEIEDSDVAYDPEDESLFNEIQDDVFQISSLNTHDSALSRAGHSVSHKGTSPNSRHSRKRRLSPKRRSNRERDRHRSPSRKSQRRSPSHSRRHRERDRHRRSEKDRLKERHRTKDQSERQARHRKEHTSRHRSRGHRRSPSTPRKNLLVSLSPKEHTVPSPQVFEDSKYSSVLNNAAAPAGHNMSSSNPVTIKNDPDGYLLKCHVVESADKDSLYSRELLHNVKLEISEPPKSHKVQKDSVSNCDDKGSASFTEQDKQQTKIETTLPLRVIDPPIRDSPESPDPEPQFLKPSGIEKSDSIKTEENGGTNTDTSFLVLVENNCLPIGNQAVVSKVLLSTFGGPISDVRNLDFRALELPDPGVRDQGTNEANIKKEGETSGLKHPQMIGEEGSYIHGSRLEMDPATECLGPGNDGTSIHPKPEMEEPGCMESVTRIKFPGPVNRVAGMQAMSLNFCRPGPHRQDPVTVMQNSKANFREPGIQFVKTDGIGSGSATIGLGLNSPEVHGPDMTNIAQEIKGHSSVINIANLQPENSRSGVMEVVGAQSFVGPQIEDRVPDLIERGRGQHNRGGRLHTRGMRSSMSSEGPSLGPPFAGPERSLEGRGSQERGFQPRGGKADLGRVVGGPQRGRGIPRRGTRQNISYESVQPNMSCIEQDNSEHRAHFREPQTNTRAKGGRDVWEIGPERDTDMQGRNIKNPELEQRNEKMAQEHREQSIKHFDLRGPEAGGIGPNMGDQRSHIKGMDQHTKGLDWRGPGSQGRGTDVRESGSIKGTPFTQNEWETGPDMDVPLRDSRGPRFLDFRRPEPERKGPAADNLGPGKRGPGVEHTDLPMDGCGTERRGPGGLDFRRPEPERIGPAMANLGLGMKAPGVELAGPVMEGPVTDRRGPGGPYFRGGSERKRQEMESQGHETMGPLGPDFRGAWPERRTLDISPGPDMTGPVGQDAWGPGPERRGPVLDCPGSKMQGLGGLEYKGPGSVRRGNTMEVPGIEKRGPGGPDYGPESRGLSMDCPGTVRVGPGRSDFRGHGLDNRGLPLERPGPDSRGYGCPAFTGPAPPAVGAAGPNRRRPEGPDFTGPGPDRRGPVTRGLGNDWRESRVSDLRGPGHESRDLSMGSQEPYNGGLGDLEFQAPEQENRALAINISGPDRRGHRVLDLGPACETRGPSIEGQGPNRTGPGDQNSCVLGPDRRGPYMGNSGPDCIGFWPERTGPYIEGTGPHSQGQLELDFGGPGPESGRGSDIREPWLQGPDRGCEGVGPNRRGTRATDFMEHRTERKLSENNSSFCRDSQFGDLEERRSSNIMGSEPNRGNPHFRQVESEITIVEGQEKSLRCPGFRGSYNMGSGPERKQPEGSGFRDIESEGQGSYMEGSGLDLRGSSCSDFRDTGIRQKGQNIKCPSHDSRDVWGGSDFRRSEHMQGTPIIEGPGPDRTGPPLSVPRPMRRNIRGRGTDKRSLIQGDRWKGTDTEHQWSDRRPNIEAVVNETGRSGNSRKRHGNRGPDDQGQDHSEQGPHDEWRGPGNWGAGPIQERLNMPFPGPMRGQKGDRSGPGCRKPGPVHDNVCPGPSRECAGNEWIEPKRGVSGPNRRGPGPFFRGERDPDNESHGRSQLDIRGSYVAKDFRGNIRRPNIERPGAYRGGPGPISSCSNERGFEMEGVNKKCLDLQYVGPGNRNPVTEGPRTGGRFSDCGGLGSERPDIDMESHKPKRQGFEHTYRRENRGIDLRRPEPGSGKSSDISHGPDRWDTKTECSQFDNRGPAMIGPGLDSEPPTISGMRHMEPGHRSRMTSNDRRGPALRHFAKSETHNSNNPHELTRFKDLSHPHSEPYNRPQVPALNRGRKLCPGLDKEQNRQAAKPQRHRAALLPTPTEGLIRFPNHMINNPDVSRQKKN